MSGTTDILAPMIIKEIQEVGNRACRFVLVPKNEAVLGCQVSFDKLTPDQHAYRDRGVNSDYGNGVTRYKYFEKGLTNSIYHVICRLFQQLFRVRLVDHLQRLVVRIHRRLMNTPSWGRLDAKNQVQLDLRRLH